MKVYSTVRVVRLNKSDREFDGTEGVKRAPRIDDIGTVVHVLSPEDVIVECVDAEGYTIWLADFRVNELQHQSPEVAAPSGGIMDERITGITSALKQVADDAKAGFGNLSSEQLNWKPSESGWSVGQCFDHIIKTNHEFFPEFDRLASGERKNSFFENYSPLSGFFGRFLIKAVSEDSKKAKAPSNRIVPPSDIPPDIIDRFASHIEEVNQKVEACAAADRQKTVVTSPFLAVFTYKLDDAYTVLVEHSKRHLRQAKRVTEADGFPK